MGHTAEEETLPLDHPPGTEVCSPYRCHGRWDGALGPEPPLRRTGLGWAQGTARETRRGRLAPVRRPIPGVNHA